MTVFSIGTLIWQTYERLLSKNLLGEKGRDSFDPQCVNLLGEDPICMANLLVISQKIVVFLIHD